ncbi:MULTISPECIES: hypothetical protein [unclassified Acidovorax]|uniref:hypothetical protein n=1 Tax=unclassified Acidovorax TaxID=2684926 RepID=UPI001C46B2FC|nr:hypothetical protein [Acidovorax sp. sif0632]MBV7465629.1 hypothetical protein [Acidovorax sp. sif0613]
MPHSNLAAATAACEEAIDRDRRYNIENGIWPSSVIVADRFLARRLELVDAYAEIHAKLSSTWRGLDVFFDTLFSAATVWHPDEMQQARSDCQELIELNRQIERQASALAGLMDRRTDLSNASGFGSGTHYHVVDVIAKAATDLPAFNGWVQEPLDVVRSRFDLKYWPTPADFVRELARDAGGATPQPTDPITQAATSGRAAKSDFFKGFFELLRENSARNHGPLPRDFELSDRTLASLGNCALDLGPDDLVTDAYVKGIRQRRREGEKRGKMPPDSAAV